MAVLLVPGLVAAVVSSRSAGAVDGAAPAMSAAVSGSDPASLPGVQDGLYQVPHNGHFTFTRVRYGSGGVRGFGRGRRGWGSAWDHDYPDGDRNLQTILGGFTSVAANTGGSNVLDLENPEIFKHPILYMSEPGFWTVTEEGARVTPRYMVIFPVDPTNDAYRPGVNYII